MMKNDSPLHWLFRISVKTPGKQFCLDLTLGNPYIRLLYYFELIHNVSDFDVSWSGFLYVLASIDTSFLLSRKICEIIPSFLHCIRTVDIQLSWYYWLKVMIVRVNFSLCLGRIFQINVAQIRLKGHNIQKKVIFNKVKWPIGNTYCCQ